MSALFERLDRGLGGIRLYGIAPPKRASDPERLREIADQQVARLRMLAPEGLVVYDIQDEPGRIGQPRPFPFLPTVDPEAYAYMRGCAPYDNVAALDYPPILAETSLNDTRVLYVEAAKWVARLRDHAVGRRDFLLKTEMAAGHGGVSGRYKAWTDRAFTLAWILDRMGLADS